MPRVVLLALCLVPLLAGCGGDRSPRDRDWSTLYCHLSQNPTTLDPAQARDVAGGAIIARIYGTLLAFDASGKLVGDVADRFSISPDGTTWEFHLRAGLKFANGRAVTADDVVWSFKRTLSPETRSPRTWVLDHIKGAAEFAAGSATDVEGLRAVDNATLVIRLDAPFAPFAARLTMPAAAVVPREVTDFSGAGFGSGPFQVESFRSNESLTLVRNPCYPGPGPKLQRIVYKIIQPPVARLAEFRRGLIDVMGVPDDYYDSLASDPQTAKLITRSDSLNVYFLGINCTSAPFNDPAVRRALAQSLNVKTVSQALFGDRAVLATGPIPPGLPGGAPGGTGIAFDLDAAKKVLAAAGLGKGRPVRFLCGADKDTANICQTLLGELRKAGLDVQLTQREGGTFKQMLRNGDFDLYYYSWWADYPDPENFLAPLFLTSADRGGGNPTGYSNPQVDGMIRELQGELGTDKRAELCTRIRQAVASDAPRIWLWHRQELTLRQPWVRDYVLSPIYNMDKGNLVWISRP